MMLYQQCCRQKKLIIATIFGTENIHQVFQGNVILKILIELFKDIWPFHIIILSLIQIKIKHHPRKSSTNFHSLSDSIIFRVKF